jgi:metal-sulfur cluster biosynthetic enzyme
MSSEFPEVDLTGGTATLSVEDVEEAMKDVVDPELGINVVDLGLVYGINIDDSKNVVLDMTLTSAACPLTDVIMDQTNQALDGMANDVAINWVWMPPWGPDKITDEGREMLRALGDNFERRVFPPPTSGRARSGCRRRPERLRPGEEVPVAEHSRELSRLFQRRQPNVLDDLTEGLDSSTLFRVQRLVVEARGRADAVRVVEATFGLPLRVVRSVVGLSRPDSNPHDRGGDERHRQP